MRGPFLASLASRVGGRREWYIVIKVGQILWHLDIHSVNHIATLLNYGQYEVAAKKEETRSIKMMIKCERCSRGDVGIRS